MSKGRKLMKNLLSIFSLCLLFTSCMWNPEVQSLHGSYVGEVQGEGSQCDVTLGGGVSVPFTYHVVTVSLGEEKLSYKIPAHEIDFEVNTSEINNEEESSFTFGGIDVKLITSTDENNNDGTVSIHIKNENKTCIIEVDNLRSKLNPMEAANKSLREMNNRPPQGIAL